MLFCPEYHSYITNITFIYAQSYIRSHMWIRFFSQIEVSQFSKHCLAHSTNRAIVIDYKEDLSDGNVLYLEYICKHLNLITIYSKYFITTAVSIFTSNRDIELSNNNNNNNSKYNVIITRQKLITNGFFMLRLWILLSGERKRKRRM